MRYKPWAPRHFRLMLQDLTGSGNQPLLEHKIHLKGAIDWLCRAQDINDDGGVSAGWSFEDGWLPSYPETTGYIIETFLAAADILDNKYLIERANRMIDWELSLQMENGAFPGHFGEPGSQPVIFNTGQIMHGMVAGYVQVKRHECLDAAVKAGYWLLSQQDEDGCWRKFEHNNVPHVYNTRATWALVSIALLAGDADVVGGGRDGSGAFHRGGDLVPHSLEGASDVECQAGFVLGHQDLHFEGDGPLSVGRWQRYKWGTK